MMHHHQYVTDISPNNRPQQQSSPSDDNSMSTATPPQISRASPASTALVMSSNNIDGVAQPTSRQLTPNTSSSNNGTGSSSNGNTGTHHNGAPNPMIRQFTLHNKSMSAGFPVSVPGHSYNLATITGMNQNNMINNNIATSNQHHRALPLDPNAHTNSTNHSHHNRNLHYQQQVIRERRNHHHQQLSQPSAHHHLQQQQLQHHQQQQQHQHQHQHQQQQHQFSQNGSSNNFINARQATSSIILSNNNINNIHNRSASTHLSNALLENQHAHSQSNHHITNQRNYPPTVSNSIWSIDENIRKSHGKLTASGFLPDPSYVFNPSITDMSCDNVSNASRLIDGGPAPSYYIHANSNLPNSNVLSVSGSLKTAEFLPIYELIFYLISMIIYFCENIFGIIALIALYYHTANIYWALVGGAFVFSSNFACQYISFKWLYKSKSEECKRKREAQEELENEEDCERRHHNRLAANMKNYQCGSCAWLPDSATELQLKFLLSIALDALLHIFCIGFLFRYVKLVIPIIDTTRVKKEMRELCILRMIHGFVQSAPLLLLQAYLICSQTSTAGITSLSATSAILSLINVCWAAASFTKYARKRYMNKFELTWLGIVSQLLWRLGTISSRVAALTIYAVYYSYWMLVVLALHWITMFFWRIKPGNRLRDEVNLSGVKKVSFAMAAAWMDCICYINFEEHNSKMTIYYLIMFLENNLLLTVCLIFSAQMTWFKNLSILVVYLGFVFGMLFMFLYYKCFHVNVLNHGLSCSNESIDSIADQLSAAGKKVAGFKPGTLGRLKSKDSLNSGLRYNSNISATLHTGSHPEIGRNVKLPYLTAGGVPSLQSGVLDSKSISGFKKQKIPNSHVNRHNQ